MIRVRTMELKGIVMGMMGIMMEMVMMEIMGMGMTRMECCF